MDINLEEIISSETIPDSTLVSAVALLEETLPSYRRDLAYTLANVRRVEQKYKQAHDEVVKYNRALEVAKVRNNPDSIQIILGDRLHVTQTLSKLKQEYESLTNKAQTFKHKITATEAQIQKIQEKRKNLKSKIQIAQRRKYYYMALGVIDASFLVNVIEYPVIQEAISQHSQLAVDIRIKFKPIEVAAYALNRLPSMYVTTLDDYNQQIRFVSNDMKPKISDAVKRAIHSLRMGDPLHDSTPLPDELFCEPAGLLGCLSLAFNRKDLRWSDIPKILLKLKEQRSPSTPSISPQTSSGSIHYIRQSQASNVQMYLQRSKLRHSNHEQEEQSSRNPSVETKFLELYTLRGKLKFVNVIEKLALAQALFLMIDIFDESSNSAQILAHTLNKLPPLYTTSERGLNQICKYFFTNQAESVNALISNSHTQLQGQIYKKNNPLYFKQFNLEYQTAILEIIKILNRPDLSPENLVTVIQDFVSSG